MEVSRSRKVGLRICMNHLWDGDETTDAGWSKSAKEGRVQAVKLSVTKGKNQRAEAGSKQVDEGVAWASKKQEEKWFENGSEKTGDKYPSGVQKPGGCEGANSTPLRDRWGPGEEGPFGGDLTKHSWQKVSGLYGGSGVSKLQLFILSFSDFGFSSTVYSKLQANPTLFVPWQFS